MRRTSACPNHPEETRRTRVSVYDNCKIVADINPARRDENIDYYLDKLKLLYKKLAPVLTEKHRP